MLRRQLSLSARSVSVIKAVWSSILISATGGAIALFLMDRAEQKEFEKLVNQARVEAPAVESEADVLSIMSTVNRRLKRIHLPDQAAPSETTEVSIRSSHDHLLAPTGACASYSHVLAKALMTAGYDVRKVGLGKDGKLAIHHVIEARIGPSWVLLDAFYNQAFRTKDGHLAGASSVHGDWNWYRQQVVADYDQRFDYSTYYYTNWARIPVVGWVVKSWPPLHAWLHGHRVSVRFWFFNTYRWLAFLCFMVAIMAAWALRRMVKSGGAFRRAG